MNPLFTDEDKLPSHRETVTKNEGGGSLKMDDIDLAIIKSQEEHESLKKLKIEKIKPQYYKVEKKDYTIKMLQGNILVIKMLAGYI